MVIEEGFTLAKILVVDDSRTARMMCNAAISKQRPDFITIEAADGATALEAVAEQEPDLAILDMNMPGMDGLELAGRLRRQFPRLPICLLTANVQASSRRRAEEAEVFFFGKPLTEAAMREMLAHVQA